MSSQKTTNSARKFIFPMVVFFGTLALCLFFLEAVVRALEIAPELPKSYIRYSTNPHLPWGPVPGSQYEAISAKDNFQYQVKHNSLGLRDVEHTEIAPEGTLRILALGDSFTYGWGAAYEDTYLYLLEKRLNSTITNRHIEIIKAGVGRYFPEPERMLLESLGPRFRPDIVLVGFVANDVIDTCMGLDAVGVGRNGQLMNSPGRVFGDVGLSIYEHSHIGRILLRAWVNFNFLRICPSTLSVYGENGIHEQHWRRVEREYQQILAISTRLGARMIILNIPDIPPWTAAHSYIAERLGPWSEARGIGFIDALPAMQTAAATSSDPLYWTYDPHCTPAGYAVIAETLYDYLLPILE